MKSCSVKNDNYAKSFSLVDKDKIKQDLISSFVKKWPIITSVLEKTTINLCLIVYFSKAQ